MLEQHPSYVTGGAFVVVASTWLPGCVDSSTDRRVESTDEIVSISGLAWDHRGAIDLYGAPTPEGPFYRFATTFPSDMPIDPEAELALYPWSFTGVLEGRWAGNLCDGYEYYVRAQTRRGERLCVNSFAELRSCDGENTDLIRFYTDPNPGPAVHHGDLVIDSSEVARQWSCVERVEGDLDVPDSDVVVTLSRLTTVSGNLALAYTRVSEEYTRVVDAPALRMLGGDLTITAPLAYPASRAHLAASNFVFESLSEVGGDIRILLGGTVENTWLRGFSSLTEMDGSLTIVAGRDDTTLGFNNLRRSGPVHLDLGYNYQGGLDNLETVHGDFTLVSGNLDLPGFFTGLRTVEGDFSLSGARFSGRFENVPAFEHLERVAGTLTYRDNRGHPSLRVGGPLLRVGGLDVADNRDLVMVGGEHVRVDPTGDISFSNNVNLCTSAVDTFMMGLPGWIGSGSNTGNADC